MSRLVDRVEIAHPHEPHVATILLLDTSQSMEDDEKIVQLNQGLHHFRNSVNNDTLSRKRVDLSVITFGGEVNVIHKFSPINLFEPPTLTADGGTPMGDAILTAIDLLRTRKRHYKRIGIDYFRPWIVLITDGEPTDMTKGNHRWKQVTTAISQGEANKEFLFFAVGVDAANMELLSKIAPKNRKPLKLKEGCFNEMFQWLSNSMSSVSRSQFDTPVKLPSYDGWGTIEV